jgi:LysR family transcriptional regulator, low CO2-responsive transcriptional regulator
MKFLIESRHLHTFVTLARTLHLSNAAKELKMTPSAVSHALKALESDLGCQLFDRSPRHVRLTQAGRDLLPEATSVIEQLQQMRIRVENSRSVSTNRIRVGASATACQFILPPVLREFRESFPDCILKIEQCDPRVAASHLAENRIDFAIMVEPPRNPSLQFRLLGEDDLQFVVHPLHEWAIKRRVPRSEVIARKLIVPDSTSETYALIKTYFRREELDIHPFIEVANEEAIKSFLSLDMGVGILPRWLVADDIERGLLTALPLGRRSLKRRWMLMHSKRHSLNIAEALFVSLCTGVVKELVSQGA